MSVFVSEYAKSATTLIALGGDEIWLSETAELGPLDAQIQSLRNPDDFASALQVFTAVDYLRQHGYEIMDEWMKMMIRRTSCNPADAASRIGRAGIRIRRGEFQ